MLILLIVFVAGGVGFFAFYFMQPPIPSTVPAMDPAHSPPSVASEATASLTNASSAQITNSPALAPEEIRTRVSSILKTPSDSK